VDLGTGSGAVAVALATEGRFGTVIGTDVSADALAVAAKNVALAAPAARIELRRGSLFEPLSGVVASVLVSNPPYLTTDEYQELPSSVRDYEPRLAFDGGPDGLQVTREILCRAAHHLVDGGLLALEIDSRRGRATLAAARAAGWKRAAISRDVFGRDRYLLAVKE
jgi:release factor glutamine methyltransferase